MNKQLFENFFSVLNSKVKFVKEVKREYSKTLASDFNALNFWTLDENKVSEIIGFFLDPKGSHGQEDLYLKLFLKRFTINFPVNSLDEVEITLEKRTHNNRRLDIFISNRYCRNVIGFENKIYYWTKDHHNQVDDYLDFLNGITREKKFTLFYLSPKNKKISEHSFNKQKFEETFLPENLRIINYEEDIIPLIRDFAINSENDRVRSFLLDFERKLKNLYMGNSDINERHIVKNYITENAENLDTAFTIFNNIPELKKNLKEQFFEQMVEISAELNVSIDQSRNRFYISKLGSNKIAVNFEAGGLIYGLMRDKEDFAKKRHPEVEGLFLENFQVSPWWSMWRWMYEDIEHSPGFWQAVIDGSAKTIIMDFIKKIISEDFKFE